MAIPINNLPTTNIPSPLDASSATVPIMNEIEPAIIDLFRPNRSAKTPPRIAPIIAPTRTALVAIDS